MKTDRNHFIFQLLTELRFQFLVDIFSTYYLLPMKHEAAGVPGQVHHLDNNVASGHGSVVWYHGQVSAGLGTCVNSVTSTLTDMGQCLHNQQYVIIITFN